MTSSKTNWNKIQTHYKQHINKKKAVSVEVAMENWSPSQDDK